MPPDSLTPLSARVPAGDRLLALVCPRCASPLLFSPGAAVYPCRSCRRLYEPSGRRLREIPAEHVRLTSAIAARGRVQLLPVWRFAAQVEVRSRRAAHPAAPGFNWEQVKRKAASPAVFVPAFALERTVVARLGLRLLRAQPALSRAATSAHPEGVSLAAEADLLPILLSEADARIAAHFVYLALESDSTPDLRAIDYDLQLERGTLLYIPADYDRSFVHDANWRLLLREFDSLLA